MTSIQPERLAKDIEQIQALITDPPRLRSRIVEILEFFSDRTRRSQSSIRSKDVERKFGVPSPVLKALERGLRQSILENSEYASAVSDELWEVEYREPRLLAIALQDQIPFDALLSKVETWSQSTKDYEILTTLADTLVRQWRAEGFKDFSEIITHWLRSKSLKTRLLSLLSMQSASQDPNFEEIPLIFHLLRVHEIYNDQEVRRALHGLLRSLVKRCSAEVARYLLDVFEEHEGHGRRLVKELLTDFPSEEQNRLKRVLSPR